MGVFWLDLNQMAGRYSPGFFCVEIPKVDRQE
jgi:hypothetical protein